MWTSGQFVEVVLEQLRINRRRHHDDHLSWSASCQAAGLRARDPQTTRELVVVQELGDLSRFAGASLARQNRHLIVVMCVENLLASAVDRQHTAALENVSVTGGPRPLGQRAQSWVLRRWVWAAVAWLRVMDSIVLI